MYDTRLPPGRAMYWVLSTRLPQICDGRWHNVSCIFADHNSGACHTISSNCWVSYIKCSVQQLRGHCYHAGHALWPFTTFWSALAVLLIVEVLCCLSDLLCQGCAQGQYRQPSHLSNIWHSRLLCPAWQYYCQ